MATPADRSLRSPTDWAALRIRLSGASVVLAVVTVLAVILLRDIVAAATQPLGWLAAAMVIALLLAPAVNLLDRWLPRAVAVIAVLAGVVAAIATVGAGLFVQIRDQLARLSDELPAAAAEIERRGGDDGVLAELGFGSLVQDVVNHTSERITPEASVEGAIGTVPAYVVTVILALFVLAWAGRMFTGFLRQISDDERRERLGVGLATTVRLTQRYVVASIALAVLTGTVGGLIAWSAGLPTPLVLGVVLAATSIAPDIGVLVGGLPLVILSVATLPMATTIAVGLALVALQAACALTCRRVIEPRSMRVGPAVIVIAVVVGAELAGVGGVLVAPVAMVAVVGAVEAFRHDQLDGDPDAQPAGSRSQ